VYTLHTWEFTLLIKWKVFFAVLTYRSNISDRVQSLRIQPKRGLPDCHASNIQRRVIKFSPKCIYCNMPMLITLPGWQNLPNVHVAFYSKHKSKPLLCNLTCNFQMHAISNCDAFTISKRQWHFSSFRMISEHYAQLFLSNYYYWNPKYRLGNVIYRGMLRLGRMSHCMRFHFLSMVIILI
jgi:hypothetical protein